MTSFHTIAVPHSDILSGRLTMEVFAADLWEVFRGRAPDEYRDPNRFFQKTYLTQGLKNLLAVVEKRLRGEGGDPVIQVQTPFGGGKTHSLIALYHKAAEWKARRVVIVGTAMDPHETLWGLLAEQLTGSRNEFQEPVAPGREAVRALLSSYQPLLILMDEVLEYATKAAGVKVGASTLAAQTVAFIQELSEAVAHLDQVCLLVTLPASLLEHYDDNAERLYRRLQKVTGRMEKIYTPVQEHEISRVIRRRLFAHVNEKALHKELKAFMEYAEREGLVPHGMEPSQYRQRFAAAYPFLPEVIDVLYQRWGSFPSFQRTRGVLRLLSLVIHAHRESALPYITLADFDLSNQEIRRELLKHIGPEYDSVIAADITDATAGARKVDQNLGHAYRGLRLGTRTATTIFMYSFSGGVEHGATIGEVKRHATTQQNPTSVVVEALHQLKQTLSYLQTPEGKVFFTNQPNLNHLLNTRMESVGEREIEGAEKKLLTERLSGRRLKTYVWPQQSSDIPDNSELKLIILRTPDETLMKEILNQKGMTNRVHRNTLIFLTPMESERPALEHLLRRHLAYHSIAQDHTLNLSKEQKQQVKNGLLQVKEDLNEQVRRTYRLVYTPGQQRQFKELDMGVPTYGTRSHLDEEVYEKLRTEGEILERLQPLVIKERYLRDRQYISTEQLTQSWSRTPGELRVVSEQIWRESIAQGVEQGLFGLGQVEDDQPRCTAFKGKSSVALTRSEVIIRADICEDQLKASKLSIEHGPLTISEGEPIVPVIPSPGAEPTPAPGESERRTLSLRFRVPKGKVADLLGILNLLQHYFDILELALDAREGRISEQDIESKLKEAFRQMGIEVEGLEE